VPAEPDRTNTSATFGWCRAQGHQQRGQYLWSVLHAARLARALGKPAVSVIEMGVAGGNGLLELERCAAIAADIFDVEVAVAGFDSGAGMPPITDRRDLPWAIEQGVLAMDVPALQARLTSAELVLGLVEETVPRWLAENHPPIGFVAFDLDLYTGTMAAFGLFEGSADRLLPRVACYFDDIFGYGWSDWAGERAAITDFNAAHERKIGKFHGLRYELPRNEAVQAWSEQIYLAHVFDAPDYDVLEQTLPRMWEDGLRLRPQ
jgi:hypothetical protein